MNISNWPLGRIMALPDHMFGRRFPVWCYNHSFIANTTWDIAEVAFPEVFVIWEFCINYWLSVDKTSTIRIGIGDQLPTTAAMMNVLEPLLPGFGSEAPVLRAFTLGGYGNLCVRNMKMPVRASGRRLVLEVNSEADSSTYVNLGVVVSGVPREIPD
ncbi:hypothetical protein ES703_21048 [subsurface metagenome]